MSIAGTSDPARRSVKSTAPRVMKSVRRRSMEGAEALGQKVTGFDEAAWTANRFTIVVRGNLEKFASSDALRAYLIGTGNRVLVEASPVDRIWGIGLDTNHKNAKVPTEWRGLNLLGFALMQARSILAERQ